MGDKKKLFEKFDKIHTIPLGEIRIKKNLALVNMDAVEFCKTQILDTKCEVTQRGKNFYCEQTTLSLLSILIHFQSSPPTSTDKLNIISHSRSARCRPLGEKSH